MKNAWLLVGGMPSGSFLTLWLFTFWLGFLPVEASEHPHPDLSVLPLQEVLEVSGVEKVTGGVTGRLSTSSPKERPADIPQQLVNVTGEPGKLNAVTSAAEGNDAGFSLVSRSPDHYPLVSAEEATEDVRVLGNEDGVDSSLQHHVSELERITNHNNLARINDTVNETGTLPTKKVNEKPQDRREEPKNSVNREKQSSRNEMKASRMKTNDSGTEDDDEKGERSEKTAEDADKQETQKSGWFSDTEVLDVAVVPVITHLSTHAHTHTHVHAHANTSPELEKAESLLTVEFLTKEHHIILDLHPTRDLLGASYTEPAHGEVSVWPRQCEYQGVVRGVIGSWVALSLCNVIRGVVVGGDQELLVEPTPGASNLKEPHRILSASLIPHSSGACGVKDGNMRGPREFLGTRRLNKTSEDSRTSENKSSTWDTTQNTRSDSQRVRREALRGSGELWGAAATRFVELVLVADHSYYTVHGSNTHARCRTIVNIVNALYRPLGVVVVLVHLEVLTSRGQIEVTSDFKKSLDELRTYRHRFLQERPDLPNDNTVLLTTVDFEGQTVGYASVSGMCSKKNSVAVVEDKQSHEGIVAQTVAHEMGHNLGMNHDDDGAKECHCQSRKCLMSSSGSATYREETSWSSCSRESLATGIQSGYFDCLKNVPTKLVSGASCGDGVVDVYAGEQCDCGPHKFCDNPCCVPTTCRLAVNASCASGSCCDTQKCELKRIGSKCREARSECDLPEYCKGDSEYCPDDVLKGDGTSCWGGKGHCHRGKCGSHEARCHQVWGATASVASPRCYENNRKGSSLGNCGVTSTSKTELRPCGTQDTFCGTLQCRLPKNEEPKLPGGGYVHGFWTINEDICRFIYSSSEAHPSLWLTPDGAHCGSNKMCVNQRCVEIAAPDGDCRDGCSGRGVCNNRGHCHCDPGFAPPDCSSLGPGGSIDSGEAKIRRDVNPLVEAMYILGLLLAAIVIILCCLWSRVKSWWEREGQGSCTPCCTACVNSCCCPLMDKLIHWILTVRLFKKERKRTGEVSRVPEETNKMICDVDLDFKSSPHAQGQVRLPSHSPPIYPKSGEGERPTYVQSISADSGCVVDIEEGSTKPAFTSQMSMTSLITVFRRIGSRSSKAPSEKENQRSRAFGSQKSMPLSRFVVDPLAGNGNSRQGTPPSDSLKTDFHRSVSTDVTFNARGRPEGAPPPPPNKLKPHKSVESLMNGSKVSKSPFMQLEKEDQPVKSNSSNKIANSGILNGKTNPREKKTPLMPPDKACTPQRTSPARAAPSIPTKRTPPDDTKRPLMPPGKGNTVVLADVANTRSKAPFAHRPTVEERTSPPVVPMPLQHSKTAGPPKQSNMGPRKQLNVSPPKSQGTGWQSRHQESVSVHATSGKNVKELARRLEHS
ncbi:uncharacterized protein [Cherax quadricarinatus]|uniref:uncharacterized protein isoform X2 n=1 Tax=Cherax quadricarinatus TaxID=27406 RepID=UPI00387E93BA